MKLYSYVVTHDTGFSPNPFWGYCTLADCKPVIRRTASVGDWIVGLSPKRDGNRVVYAMEVGEILPYEDYYRDKRFGAKIPDLKAKEVIHKCGDNIYKSLPSGGFLQLPSMHSHGLEEDSKKKKRDLGGVNVLISRKFHYFGPQGPELPDDLAKLKVSRGHKSQFDQQSISKFLKFMATQPEGMSAQPTEWPQKDQTWRVGQRCG
jgi:hypothetical protein